MPDWGQISAQLQAATGVSLAVTSARPVGGGCISSAFVLDGVGGEERYLVKTHRPSAVAMFEAERDGLLELAVGDHLRVPRPLHCGLSREHAYLVMEYVPLQAQGDQHLLGQGLAALHRTAASTRSLSDLSDRSEQGGRARPFFRSFEENSRSYLTKRIGKMDRSPTGAVDQSQTRQAPRAGLSGRFGWHRDNTIGATPQLNAWADDWVRFWAEQRLGYQLRLAANNGAGLAFVRRGEKLQAGLAAFFSDYQPQASRLHGDLWSGNTAFDEGGRPVIFDPAVYFGDRETDLAMTELFGGFSREFYAAYRAAWPLDAGYATRKTLYNLYHILNHYNLFGGGYLAQAQGMVDRLLAEC